MKKIMKLFVYVAAAAMTLASCQKNEIDNQVPQEYEYTFLIGSADTKAVIGENCVEWEQGDRVGSFTKSNNGYSEVSINEGIATISVYSSGGLAVNDKLYFYYPQVQGNEVQKTAVPMSIPTIQDAKDDMPMVSLPFEVKAESTENKTPYAGEIKFANLGAVIEFHVYSTTEAYQTEVVKSVTFNAEQAIAGDFTFDLTAVDYSKEETLAISGYEATTVVSTLSTSTQVSADKNAATVVKMVVAPGSYTGNVVVTTDKAIYTYPISTAKAFKRSGVQPFGLNLRENVRQENSSSEPVEITATLTFDDKSKRTEYSTLKQVWTENGIILTNEKEDASTNVGDYSQPARFYKGSKIYVEAPGNIVNIVFNCNSSEYATDLNNSITNSYRSGNDVTVTLEGNSTKSPEYKMSAKVFVNSVTVTYMSVEGGETPEQPATPVLTVNPQVVEVEAAGGAEEITYTVTNPVEGTSVDASTEATWITNLTTSEGKVTFNVEEHIETAGRTATITLAYEGAESVTITVTQAGKPAEGGEADVEVWSWAGGGKAEFTGGNIEKTYGLGSDYAAGHAPYQIKMDDTGDYFIIKVDGAIKSVSVGVKMIGGGNTSTLDVQGSSDGGSYSSVEELTISGSQNDILELQTTKQFDPSYRYLKFNFTKGSNVGVGPITITYIPDNNEGGGEEPEPETPVYASLADLVAAGEPTADGSKVTVTLTDEKITDIDVTSSGYRNGVFLQVGDRKIEIYSRNVPEDWVVGGTISGTLTECVWKLYNSTWELCPANWSELTYKAPEGGSTEPEEPAAPVVATVAQFLAAAEDDVVYEITGVITSVDNTEYGNFYLTDSTGEVLIYGLCSPTGEQKYWQTAGVEVGDIITVRTVRTSHQGTPQGKNALYVSDVNFYIDHTEINVTAEQTTAKFDLSVDVGYTIEYPVGVTELSDEHNNDTATTTYTVEFPANEDAEIKTYEIKIVADASFILENPIEGVDYARTVTIKQAAASQGGGAYSVIKSVADLSAGTYLLGGNNKDKYADGTMYMWSNASSVSGQKLKTSAVTFTNGNFDADVSSYVHVELIATAKSNVYYIKLGAKYLKGAVKVWSLVDTPVEWTFADMGGTKDGMYFYNEANASYVFINSTTDAIRTYGNSTKYKGIYLFKAN